MLNTRGEGILNVAFAVDNIEKEAAKLTDKGIEIILNGKFNGGGGLIHFETRKSGNVIIQLIEPRKA